MQSKRDRLKAVSKKFRTAHLSAKKPVTPKPQKKWVRRPSREITAADRKLGGAPRLLQPDAKTLDLIRGLGQIWATTKECAAVLKVTEHTFLSFVHSEPEAFEAYEGGKESGKVSLRRAQFNLAVNGGNATMQIFLGKNMLGQKDKHEIDGRFLIYDLSRLTDQQLDQLEGILGPLAITDGHQGGAGEAGGGAGA